MPVWLLSAGQGPADRVQALEALGIEIIVCQSTGDGKVDLADAMEKLAGRGINRVLTEGGAQMARAFLAADLVDEVQLFTAPKELGPGGVRALAGLRLAEITASSRFRLLSREQLGEDVLTAYERTA
jgi:diaminohydroxyphosphoribosylaminopyrimidine deaminase/5-amino-6-(5-phosphoribosylamino)uracil reductase